MTRSPYIRTRITTTCLSRQEADAVYNRAISQGYDAYIEQSYAGTIYYVIQYRGE